MNAKLAADITAEDNSSLLNPFVHHLELETTSAKIKTAFLTVVLLPIRVVLICILLITGWLLACVGLWGMTEEDLQKKPVTGWRSLIKVVASYPVLWMFYVGGFRVKIIGKRSTRNEAAIVSLAPHSSFIDALAMVYMGAPSIVAKGETATIPFFGSRQLSQVLCFLGRTTYRAGGMQVVFKGEQASREEAPILVIAPHSTFLDGGIIYFTGFPTIIVRRESASNPYIGKLINFTQPVYVWRDDPYSRQNTIKEIISRARSKDDWPQILIFPEGTCTNRSCLITFKPGAFYPGVPIQPVCIRYPNKLDTVTWTWEGPSALKLLWLTLTQVHSYCEIEFLPVYTPSEEEKKDPKLFANNVRAVMAKALGVPVMDYTYDDCKLMTRAKEMNLPNANALVEVQKLRHRLGLDERETEERIINQIGCKDCKQINYSQFALLLNVHISDPNLKHLFRLYDKDSTGIIDLREYLLGVIGVSNRKSLEIIKLGFKIYDSSGVGNLSLEDFRLVLTHTLASSDYESQEIFYRIGGTQLNYITYDQFVDYAKKKAEFASLFSLYKDEVKGRNGEICPNESSKKTE